MGRVSRRSQIRHHDRNRKETDPHKHLLRENAGSDLGHIFRRLQRDPHPFLYNIWNADKMILGKNGTDCHDTGHNRTENRRDGGSGNLQPGEAKVSADQKIVEDHVYQVGGYVGAHGDLRVSRTSLGRVDHHGNNVEHHAAHDNTEIDHGALMGIFVGSAESDNGVREGNADQADHGSGKNRERHRH